MRTPAAEPGDGPRLVGHHTDFSLVLGGPLFQLLRRAHLSDDALMMARHRPSAHAFTLLAVAHGAMVASLTANRNFHLAAATLAPIVPLALTMMPLEELLKKLLGILL